MKKYVINGLFLSQKITGIQRNAIGLLDELDKLVEDYDLEVVVPDVPIDYPQYKHIRLVKYGKNGGLFWEQYYLLKYIKKTKRIGIHLCNVVPLLAPVGIVYVYDISYKVNPDFFKGIRNNLSRIWHCVNYSIICKYAVKIITTSQFSKKEIMAVYKIPQEKIVVVYCWWQHLNKIKTTEDIFSKYPFLSYGEYYYSMSSIAKNKNFEWILKTAAKNPQFKFVIGGGGDFKALEKSTGIHNLENVYYLGYVSDEDAKAFMANCKAFLFPSLYEGFGLPPLEAIASGAPAICLNNIECLYEIYGEYANYINVEENNIKEFEPINITKRQELLNKYSCEKSADNLFKVLYY